MIDPSFQNLLFGRRNHEVAACTFNGSSATRQPTLKNDPVRQAFTNSESRVMVTSSPTRMPPVSRAAFQVKPKSFRLIIVFADIATRVLGPKASDILEAIELC